MKCICCKDNETYLDYGDDNKYCLECLGAGCDFRRKRGATDCGRPSILEIYSKNSQSIEPDDTEYWQSVEKMADHINETVFPNYRRAMAARFEQTSDYIRHIDKDGKIVDSQLLSDPINTRICDLIKEKQRKNWPSLPPEE